MTNKFPGHDFGMIKTAKYLFECKEEIWINIIIMLLDDDEDSVLMIILKNCCGISSGLASQFEFLEV